MQLPRRHLAALLPALAVKAAAQSATLPSKIYHNDQIPYDGDEQKKGRRFFFGATHSEFKLEMHETIRGKGTATHAPHKHEHEEIIIVVEGTVETYLEGKTETAR